MIYINKDNSLRITENFNLADEIREKRKLSGCTEEGVKRTLDIFEKSECVKVTYPQYTKFAVIDTPTPPIKKEMGEVMTGFYNGKISEEEVKDFFIEYCEIGYARDENRILNVYESFLDENYAAAVRACFREAKAIAEEEGVIENRYVYYNADYYYKSEEIHDLLQETAKEYAEKYGIKLEPSKRDENFKQDYLTGVPNFHDKWNFMAANMHKVGRLMDIDSVPPKDFSFFYAAGENMGGEGSLLIISGDEWIERMEVPFETPKPGKKSKDYFYLLDLFQVNSREENSKDYNDFLNKLVINRIAPYIVIERR